MKTRKDFLKSGLLEKILDTLLYSSKHNVRGLLFMVDFEKAFDSGGVVIYKEVD